jgi:hypothetical protein
MLMHLHFEQAVAHRYIERAAGKRIRNSRIQRGNISDLPDRLKSRRHVRAIGC